MFGCQSLVAEQLTQIFDEAEDDNARRSHQANKEQNREQMQDELQQSSHDNIVTRQLRGSGMLDSP